MKPSIHIIVYLSETHNNGVALKLYHMSHPLIMCERAVSEGVEESLPFCRRISLASVFSVVAELLPCAVSGMRAVERGAGAQLEQTHIYRGASRGNNRTK